MIDIVNSFILVMTAILGIVFIFALLGLIICIFYRLPSGNEYNFLTLNDI